MQDFSDDERKLVLREVMMDEFKAIREGISALPTRIEFNGLKQSVDTIQSDMKVMKALWIDHESRINKLEKIAK